MTQKELDRVKRAVIRKYPILASLALHNVTIELTDKVETAAVVGEPDDKGVLQVKRMVVNPDFFDTLSFSERVFVLAHETLHIAFRHFARSAKKPEKDIQRKYQEYCEKESDPQKREMMKIKLHNHYHQMWNIATDACINALLKEAGFSFPQNVINPKTGKPMQFVDMEEGLRKSAEKIYDYLYQKEEEEEKKKQQDQQKQQEQQEGDQQQKQQEGDQQQKQQEGDQQQKQQEDDQQENSQEEQSRSSRVSIDDVDIDDYDGFDSHDSWTGDDENEKKNDNEPQNSEEADEEEVDEESAVEQEKQTQNKEEPSLDEALKKTRQSGSIGKFIPFKPVLSWKRLLVGSLEKTEEQWGTRRISRYNPNSRMEERIVEGKASVEVVLDASPSVSDDLLKGFLLQLFPIFEEIFGEEGISMKVGCFSENFYGWQDIQSKKDIETYQPIHGQWTDFEAAASAFTKDPGRTITKIVFTDGILGGRQKTRVPDIIWVVFGDSMDFIPLGGRIIHVSEQEYRNMIRTRLLDVYEDEKTSGTDFKL